MKKILFLFFSFSLAYAYDALVNALLDGNLTHKISADYHEEESSPYASTKTQKMLFMYKTAPLEGIRLEVATQSFAKETQMSSTDNTLYYTEARYFGRQDTLDYQLSMNYYADTYRQSLAQKNIESTNAIGLKAQMNFEKIGTYVAYSKVLDGVYGNANTLEGKDHLLPTSSVLSSNNYMPNTQAYAIDINYALQSDLTLGSRYVIANDLHSNVSYTGIYSTFKAHEIAKGLDIGLSYDKTRLDKQNDQFRLNLKTNF